MPSHPPWSVSAYSGCSKGTLLTRAWHITTVEEIIKDLWRVVSKNLGLAPAAIVDQDINRIISGMLSVVDGIGALRTHVGSAHGHGREMYPLEPRHARLAIHAAHTLATFIVETWEAQKGNSYTEHRP